MRKRLVCSNLVTGFDFEWKTKVNKYEIKKTYIQHGFQNAGDYFAGASDFVHMLYWTKVFSASLFTK